MLFRDIKANDTLFIYDRVGIALTSEKVVNISSPHIDKTNVANGMVVDVTANGITYTFKDTTSVGYSGNLILSGDKQSILREVEAQKAGNENQIARVDILKSELPKLDAVIDQLSPERKEKKQNEERMMKMEESIASMKEMFELFLKQKKDGSK